MLKLTLVCSILGGDSCLTPSSYDKDGKTNNHMGSLKDLELVRGTKNSRRIVRDEKRRNSLLSVPMLKEDYLELAFCIQEVDRILSMMSIVYKYIVVCASCCVRTPPSVLLYVHMSFIVKIECIPNCVVLKRNFVYTHYL